MNVLVKRALDQAAVWHRDQKRKYPDVDVPYVSHAAGVALVLGRHGFEDDVIAAGALHDVLEDCGVTQPELAHLFGARVAELVNAVTEQDKSLPWEDRKRLYVERFATIPWEAQAIGLADKIDNLASIAVGARDTSNPWSMFKRGKDAQIAYFDSIARIASALPRHPIVGEFEDALAAVREL
jgi:(p)ppGpp synthase/HD superfamily hydrolase